MNEYERESLLERIDHGSIAIGEDIPEQVTVQGEELDLREFVFEIKRAETVSAAERERLEEIRLALKRERLQRRQRIEREDLSLEEAERIATGIAGIERALTALESVDSPDLEEVFRRERIEDQKQWLGFLEQIR